MLKKGIFFVWLVLFAAFPSFAQTWQEAQQKSQATLNLHWFTSRPFIYPDEQGELIGLEVEILKEFQKYLKNRYQIDVKYNWKESASFSNIIDLIKESSDFNHIGVSAFSITEEREKIVDYTLAYMPDITVLVSSKGTGIIDSFGEIDDRMSGMTAITIKGTIYEQQLKELKEKLNIDFDILYIQSDENVLDNISKSSDTFGFIDLPIYLMWLKNGEALVRQNYFTVFGTGYGFIMPEGADWNVPFNEFLSDPESKPIISKIISSHISPELFEFINSLYESDLLGTSLLTKEKEIQLALIENANLKLEREQTFKKYLIGGIVLSVLFILGIAYALFRLRESNKQLLVQKNKIESQQKDIKRKNDQLLNRNAKLMSLNEERNYLVRILAHDLRSPLSSIMGLSGIIAAGKAENVEEEREFVKTINEASHRMNVMITKILKQNEPIGDQYQILRENVDIDQLMSGVYKRYKPVADKKGIELILKPCEKINYLHTDFLFLQLIMENLISNAIKFSETQTTVELGISRQEGKLIFFVKDQGPGFTENDKLNLYSRLTPLSAKPTGQESSTGLGLSIVKKYVTELGGAVSLETEPGVGSTFYVSFQLSADNES